MDRVVRGRGATLYHTFYVNGVPTDPSPDAAKVTITTDEGVAVVTDADAIEEGTPGRVSYTLTPDQVAAVDRLTLTWTADFGGYPQVFTDVVEIVGGVYFTIAEARALSPLGDQTTYQQQDLVAARTAAEQAIEEECGLSFVPRYDRAVVNGDNTYGVRLPQPFVRSVRWAKVAGVTRDVSQVTGGGAGYIYDTAWWPRGWGNIQVGYEHGMDAPPEGVKRAALQYARDLLVQASSQSIAPGAERIITDDGTIVFGSGQATNRFAAAGVADALGPYRMPTIA